MDSQRLEELTLNAWPAQANLLYDGWVLCFSGGYTRRANSVHPLYTSSLPLEDKITRCEALSTARGQNAIFKLTGADQPPELDAALERRGYARVGATSVQTTELGSLQTDMDTVVELTDRVEDTWLESFVALSMTPAQHHAHVRALLERIVPPHVFGRVSVGGQDVALGLAVVEDGWAGLFDIVVAPSMHRQGLGRAVVTQLLQWSVAHSADRAYLAVTLDNAPARRLYAGFGFKEAYRYWYRQR